MTEKLAYLWPEIFVFLGACVVMLVGLSPAAAVRNLCAPLTLVFLAIAGVAAFMEPESSSSLLPGMASYAKGLTAIVGILLVLLSAGVVDREEEHEIATGRRAFDPLRTTRAEFYAFFLFSLMGLMLTASAETLIWLFLALELTSLPTYVMVTLSTRGTRSQEAGVKYFFLGALGAAIFLYGFALLYGGTGTTDLAEIRASFAENGINPIAMVGLVLSMIGVCFKIAAVPMHAYAADVYQGASSPVSAFLAFVPKAAGFFSLLLLAAAAGWEWGPSGESLPEPVRITLFVVAVCTMFVGNTLAWLQSSTKRILAYSSVAHSGYMLVGVIAGPGEGTFATSGVSAVLLYLLIYGVSNVGTFAVVACLERRAADGSYSEAESIDDLRGLGKTRPMLGWTMAICAASLLGLPPLLGFFGKLPLFTSGISAGEYLLVVVLGLNSAIAAFYYLRLIKTPLLESPDPSADAPSLNPFHGRAIAGLISAGGTLAILIGLPGLSDAVTGAGRVQGVAAEVDHGSGDHDHGHAAVELEEPSEQAERVSLRD